MTAGGEVLGNIHHLESLKKAWTHWESLPDQKHEPATVEPVDDRPIDPALEPPDNCLVLRTYTRQLQRDQDDSLRYTVPEDYPVPEAKGMRSGSPRRQAARFREAGHDFMWIPELEWRTLIPKEPSKGDRALIPESLKLRILRFHLDPERGLGEAQWFTRSKASDGMIESIVESATSDSIHLRLEGDAKLRRESSSRPPTTYEPSLLGYVSYDRKKGLITDFKMIALGDVLNTPRGVRPGQHPLGISFEFVTNPTPAERVVPRGGRDNLDLYMAGGRD